jgi:hypothetical protein
MIEKSYTVAFNGEQYDLHLRLCDDGFLSGAERAAAETLIGATLPALNPGSPPPRSVFWTNEAACNRVMSLIVAEAVDGGWKAPSGKMTPFPWRSWYDLDTEVVEAMITDFFTRLTEKMKRLRPSVTFMGTSLTDLTISVFAHVRRASITDASSQQETSTEPTAPGEPAHSTTSSDT